MAPPPKGGQKRENMKKLIENGIRLQILMRNDVKTDEISSN